MSSVASGCLGHSFLFSSATGVAEFLFVPGRAQQRADPPVQFRFGLPGDSMAADLKVAALSSQDGRAEEAVRDPPGTGHTSGCQGSQSRDQLHSKAIRSAAHLPPKLSASSRTSSARLGRTSVTMFRSASEGSG